jgi:molybdate transport system permease protein
VRRPTVAGVLAAAALALLLAFLVLPIVALVLRVPPGDLLSRLDDPVARDALWLSVRTTVVALVVVVVVGTPAAWVLARHRVPARRVVQTLIELPLVLPPAVAGLALLVALGPHGLLGPLLDDLGISLVLETAGVVVALVFVSAPFYVRAAETAFAALDDDLLAVSRTLGASEWRTAWRVGLPVARSALVAGGALAWARALGEFGATLLFAGSFQGITQTAPLAIYAQFATDLPAALALAVVLVAVSGALLLTAKWVDARS